MKRVAFTAWMDWRRLWCIFGYVWAELRYFVQRGWYGVSDYDAYSLYIYVSRVLANGLPVLYAGHPARYTEEEWDFRLNEMRHFFELVASDDGKGELAEVKYPQALSILVEDFFDLWY
jgi:hypothetical protein